jgi:hypothetical protein
MTRLDSDPLQDAHEALTEAGVADPRCDWAGRRKEKAHR